MIPGKTRERDHGIGLPAYADPIKDLVVILPLPALQQMEHDEVEKEESVENDAQQHVQPMVEYIEQFGEFCNLPHSILRLFSPGLQIGIFEGSSCDELQQEGISFQHFVLF